MEENAGNLNLRPWLLGEGTHKEEPAGWLWFHGRWERQNGKETKKINKYTEHAGHDFTRWRSEKQRFLGGHIFIGIFVEIIMTSAGGLLSAVLFFPPSSNKVFLFFFNGHVKSWLLSMRVLFVSHMENDPFENETISPKWSRRHVVFLFKFSYCRTGRKWKDVWAINFRVMEWECENVAVRLCIISEQFVF